MKKVLIVSQSELPSAPTNELIASLSAMGCTCAVKTVHQLENADYDKYDILFGMEQADLRDIYHICGGDFEGKIFLLTEFIDNGVVFGPHKVG